MTEIIPATPGDTVVQESRTFYIGSGAKVNFNGDLRVNDIVVDPITSNDLPVAGEFVVRRIDLAPIVPGLPAYTSKQVHLIYFTAKKDDVINSCRVWTANAVASGLTLAKIGVYEVQSNKDLQLVQASGNNTSAFTTAHAGYNFALTAPWEKVAGQRYAIGLLVIASTMPSFTCVAGANVPVSDELLAVDPRWTGAFANQNDLPNTIPNGQLINTKLAPFVWMVP